MYNMNLVLPSYGNAPFEIRSNLTTENFLEECNLNWRVEKFPSQVNNNGIIIENNKYFNTIRTDTNKILGAVKKNYYVAQNSQLIDVITPLLEIGELQIVSAGYFGDGHKVWVQIKLPNVIRINGDETNSYLFISTSHDGKSNFTAGLSTIRVICGNTFTMNYKSAKVRIRHAQTMDSRIQQAHKQLNMTHIAIQEFETIMNQLANTPVNDKQIENTIRLVYDIDPQTTFSDLEKSEQKILEHLKTAIHHEFDSNKSLDGNAYGLFQGFTAYENHGITIRKNSNRFERIVEGVSSKRMEKAFKILNPVVLN